METKNILRQYIASEASVNQDSLEDGQSLLESGIIDSLRILKLVSFIEETFEITVLDDELIPENFESITSICSLVEEKQKAK